MLSFLICANFNTLNAQAKPLTDLEKEQLKTYTSLEKALENPDSVQALYLNYTKLNLVPVEIKKFKNLIILGLEINNIKEIPDFVFNLTKLQELGFSHNQISKIPDDIGHLKNLTSFKCWNNNITNVPNALLNLPNIRVIELKGNPIPKDEKKRILKEYPEIKILF